MHGLLEATLLRTFQHSERSGKIERERHRGTVVIQGDHDTKVPPDPVSSEQSHWHSCII
jgi:hypothetical protein